MPESKIRENTRNLGYTLGIIAVAVIIGLLYILLAPILDLIIVIVLLAGIALTVLILIASVYYLFIEKK